MPEISFTNRRASSSLSLTSFSITYSNVIRSEFGRLGIGAERIEQDLDVPALVDRHQPVAHLVTVVAWNETASMQPISSAQRAISGTTPDVDSVIRRREIAMPSPSIAIFIASRTFSKL
jgi:hypothetical protein